MLITILANHYINVFQLNWLRLVSNSMSKVSQMRTLSPKSPILLVLLQLALPIANPMQVAPVQNLNPIRMSKTILPLIIMKSITMKLLLKPKISCLLITMVSKLCLPK